MSPVRVQTAMAANELKLIVVHWQFANFVQGSHDLLKTLTVPEQKLQQAGPSARHLVMVIVLSVRAIRFKIENH